MTPRFPNRTYPTPLPATVEASEQLFQAFQEEIVHLKMTLDSARSRARVEGRYSDPAWYNAATSKLRYMTLDAERIKNHAAQLRRHARQVANNLTSQRLMAELRLVVGEEVFAQCVARAKAGET